MKNLNYLLLVILTIALLLISGCAYSLKENDSNEFTASELNYLYDRMEYLKFYGGEKGYEALQEALSAANFRHSPEVCRNRDYSKLKISDDLNEFKTNKVWTNLCITSAIQNLDAFIGLEAIEKCLEFPDEEFKDYCVKSFYNQQRYSLGPNNYKIIRDKLIGTCEKVKYLRPDFFAECVVVTTSKHFADGELCNKLSDQEMKFTRFGLNCEAWVKYGKSNALKSMDKDDLINVEDIKGIYGLDLNNDGWGDVIVKYNDGSKEVYLSLGPKPNSELMSFELLEDLSVLESSIAYLERTGQIEKDFLIN